MTVETPPAGSPVPAAGIRGGGAPTADTGAVAVGGAEEPGRGGQIGRALRGMAVELRSRGVEVREDRGTVEAGPRGRPQRVLVRPHRGDLWWWMRWPVQEGVSPELAAVPLAPLTRTAEAARRIVGAVSANGAEPGTL